MTRETKLLILVTVFIATVSILNVISVKIIAVLGLTFSVGSYAYCLTFPITDAIAETWGRKIATQVVLLGFLANIVVLLLILVAIYHPPAEFWAENDEAFRSTLGLVPRILVASMLAYLIAQLHDIAAFHFWKRVTSGRFLFVRNNLSTWVSQLLDSIIFTLVAFLGTMSASEIVAVILGQYVVKVGIALLDTPVVYGLVRWTSGKWTVSELR